MYSNREKRYLQDKSEADLAESCGLQGECAHGRLEYVGWEVELWQIAGRLLGNALFAGDSWARGTARLVGRRAGAGSGELMN